MEATINSKAIASNIKALAQFVGSSNIMAVVKANGYGHGLIQIADISLANGITCFGVSNVQEGAKLREHGIEKEIIVMSPIGPSEAREVVHHKLTPFISDRAQHTAISLAAKTIDSKASYHIEIDTGMGRSGVSYRDTETLSDILQSNQYALATGVATHFASSESDKEFTREQFLRFQSSLSLVLDSSKNVVLHCANTGATLLYPEMHLDLVRPGLALYGITPMSLTETPILLTPAMRICAEVKLVRDMAAEETVSYNRTYKLTRKSKVAVINAGYGDGYPRELSNIGNVIICGQIAPIVGRVCMDVCMVDVTDITNVNSGDEAILIGTSENNSIRVEDVARLIGTTEHDVTTRLTSRTKMRYL